MRRERRRVSTGGRGDRGSATVVMVAVVAVVLALVSALVTAAAVRGGTVRAQGAADAGALSGAAALVGLVPGGPCAVADTAVTASGAVLASCETASGVVRVAVTVHSGPFAVDADAVAGPAPPTPHRQR
ncbi:hypothetical protein ASG04_00460 [Curtobacterium sp. Leaf183]|nr:hypothetical protein ASG04_00460 [Curtobacterium sp. Leaf183]